MGRRLDVMWEPWDGHGAEHLRLSVGPTEVFAESDVLDRHGEQPVNTRYVVRADPEWRSRAVEVTVLDPAPRRLCLRSEGDGRWRDADGTPVDELDGCPDVDLGCTPFTNSLPIRRMNLGVGESAEVRAAWIKVPELEIEALDQRYTRLDERLYRYEATESGFTADLEVDEDGIVLDYPEGWRRVRPRDAG
jgi:uncharacterized protein